MTVSSDVLRRTLSTAPWAGRYPAAVALALLALCPFLVLTTAAVLFQRDLATALGTTEFGVQLTAGLSNAFYAFGAVAAADLIQRMPGRRLFVGCEALFVAGSLLAACAPGIVVFAIGRVVQGTTTGVLLVVALPPLVTNHGARHLPVSAVFINLGLFGMVTLGPVVGGIVAGTGSWRLLFVIVAAFGLAGTVTGVLAFGHQQPPAPRMGFDWVGIPIAVAAAVLPFVGVSWLSRGGVASAGFLLPLLAGLLALVVLLVAQYGKKRPLMPLTLISNTLPVVGISCAMVAGAAFTTLLELAVLHLEEIAGWGPVLVGVLLVPQAAGVGMAAALFKRALTTRWLPVLALSGLVAIAGAAVLLLVAVNSGEPLVVAGAGLLMGFGAGAGVTPGLFMGGLSVPTAKLGPTFALVELLRSEAAFILAPVLVHLAVLPTVLATGLRTALWITLVIVVASLPVLVGVLLLSGARPHTPDLHRWLSGETTAYHSPRVAALLRAR